MKICIIMANYYPEITKELLSGCLKILKKNGINKCEKVIVPGIFEIPFSISKRVKSFDGFIALGCVIKGETPHFDFISKATIDAIMHLSITYKKPIGNGIITCFNKKQAFERANSKDKDKGGESAKAALSLLGVLKNDSK